MSFGRSYIILAIFSLALVMSQASDAQATGWKWKTDWKKTIACVDWKIEKSAQHFNAALAIYNATWNSRDARVRAYWHAVHHHGRYHHYLKLRRKYEFYAKFKGSFKSSGECVVNDAEVIPTEDPEQNDSTSNS